MRAAVGPLAALCAVAALLLTTQPAFAADEAAVLHARAARLAAEGQCPAALPILRQARALDANSAEAALLEGQCLFQARDYPASIEPLSAAARLDPESGEAALLLGMASYHVGDYATAATALERAERLVPERTEVPLYRGLVLLENDPEAAASRFETAAGRRGVLEPAATYYAGVARADAGQREEAEALLKRVQEIAPGTNWAARAEEALKQPAAHYRLRRWAVIYAGLDYDSNVALRGDGVSLPPDVSGRDDGLAWWGIEAGHEVFRNAQWGGGVMGSYFGNSHFSASDFDQHQLVASFWIDRLVGEHSLLRVQPEFGQGFYDYDDYVRYYGVRAEWVHDWQRVGQGTFYGHYNLYDYRYRIPGTPAQRPILNRDGHSIRAGYDHVYAIDDETVLRGGPFGRYYAAQGSEYDYYGLGLWAGVQRKLPCEVTLDVLGSVSFDQYDDPSLYRQASESGNARQDVISLAQAALSRQIFDRTTLTTRYRYQDNQSNVGVFDYDRHIIGAYITVAFGD